MSRKNKVQLADRVARAADALAAKRFVGATDILVGIGWLDPGALERWRRGQIDCLEGAVRANLSRVSEAMRLFRSWATAKGLFASPTEYVARTPRRQTLRFSRSGDADNLEDAHLWATRHLNNRPCPVKYRMTAKASADPNPLALGEGGGPTPSPWCSAKAKARQPRARRKRKACARRRPRGSRSADAEALAIGESVGGPRARRARRKRKPRRSGESLRSAKASGHKLARFCQPITNYPSIPAPRSRSMMPPFWHAACVYQRTGGADW